MVRRRGASEIAEDPGTGLQCHSLSLGAQQVPGFEALHQDRSDIAGIVDEADGTTTVPMTERIRLMHRFGFRIVEFQDGW